MVLANAFLFYIITYYDLVFVKGRFILSHKNCNNIASGKSSKITHATIKTWCQYVDNGIIAVNEKNSKPTKIDNITIARISIAAVVNNIVRNTLNGLHTKNKLIIPEQNIVNTCIVV